MHRLIERRAVYVVDARDAAAFGGAHVPGAFGIGLGHSFGVWVGSVVPDDRPLVLVLPEETAGEARGAAWQEAVRQLLRVGYDRIAGYLEGGLRRWAVEGLPFETVPQVGPRAALARLERGEPPCWTCASPGSGPTATSPGRCTCPRAALPGTHRRAGPPAAWVVLCSTGYRSTAAASVLRRAGFADVSNVLGGMSAWEALGLPLDAPSGAPPEGVTHPSSEGRGRDPAVRVPLPPVRRALREAGPLERRPERDHLPPLLGPRSRCA